jgi:hypothetical protein
LKASSDDSGGPYKAAIVVKVSNVLETMNTSYSSVFGIRAFDTFIRVECAGSGIRDLLERYLFPPLPRSQSFAAAPDICLWVEESRDEFRVLVNHELMASTPSAADAALAAVKALDDAVVHRLRTLHAVHAGAVLVDGKALILPGSTHAGKSSLVAELLRRGASHLSDEYALIDRQGCVHAYPRPLLLRNGGLRQALTLPADLNASFALGHPVPVGWIFATSYLPGASWSIREMSQGETVMLMLRNTPHEMAETPEIVDAFVRVARSTVSYEGTRGDAAEAAEHILNFIHHK